MPNTTRKPKTAPLSAELAAECRAIEVSAGNLATRIKAKIARLNRLLALALEVEDTAAYPSIDGADALPDLFNALSESLGKIELADVDVQGAMDRIIAELADNPHWEVIDET